MFSLPLAAFPDVTLDELNENAEMLTRIDRKYVLDRDGADAFVRALDPRMRVLEIDGRRQSAYETVYFDTPDLLSYRMSAQSRRVRIKVRTRTYVESRTSFLEVKTRGGNDVTVKDRIGYQWIRRGALSEEGRAFASDAFDVALNLTSALALIPYFLSAGFGLKIGLADARVSVRARTIGFAVIAALGAVMMAARWPR